MVILLHPKLMFNCTVWNATLSPKSSMATPGRTRSSRGHITLSTRLPMVSMSRASGSLVGAWSNSCRVSGRLSLLMMARPKSSKAGSIGSREQVVHGTRTSPGHMLQEFVHCSSHIWANVVVLQPNVVSISSSLVWRQRFSRMSSYMKALTFPSGATNDGFILYENRTIPPLSRYHIEPVPEYSNVGGSHRLIAGQSVFHLYDQKCSVLSS